MWYDNRADDLTKDGMLKGIEQAAAFVLFLSKDVLLRPYCQMEIRHAVSLKKPMVMLHEVSQSPSAPGAQFLMLHLPALCLRFAPRPRVTPATEASTSVLPMRKLRLTCSSCLTTTSPCPFVGADTSVTGYERADFCT